MVLEVVMPMDENFSQHENVIRSMDEAKQPVKLATPAEEEISASGQKRPAPVDSLTDVPSTKRQRITAWLADSGSLVLAHARPLGTRVASEVKVCATKAAAATSKAATATGISVKVHGTKAAVVVGTAAKVYGIKAGTAAGNGVKACATKAATAAGNGAKAAGTGAKGCATKASVACRAAAITWSQRAIEIASQRMGRAPAVAQVNDAPRAQQEVVGKSHQEVPEMQPAPETATEALTEVAPELLELPELQLGLDEDVEDDAAWEALDAALEAPVDSEVQEEAQNDDIAEAPGMPAEEVPEVIEAFEYQGNFESPEAAEADSLQGNFESLEAGESDSLQGNFESLEAAGSDSLQGNFEDLEAAESDSLPDFSESADEAQVAEGGDLLHNLSEPEVYGEDAEMQPAMHQWQDPASGIKYYWNAEARTWMPAY